MTNPEGQTILIRCPKCGKLSDSIKRYAMPDLVVFVLIFAWTRRATYTACASCMRGIIGERLLVNLPTANIIWPILSIFWLVRLGTTFSKGHSESVLKDIGAR